ncbi:DUF6321 domain-containing protein [Bradyrhizobium betae]|uniref:DUF6321 domain-containing protein n=1 Tax=Bradyrhizobium betae TaxID=244734 RepID=UPI003D673973
MARAPRAPWKRANPRKRAGKASKHLTPSQKSSAKARARRAGRRYPNLVDNMRMAAKKTTKAKSSKTKSSKTKSSKTKSSKTKSAKSRKRKTAKKGVRKIAKTSRKRSTAAKERNPHGGLTAAGRKAFARKQGAHLKPGVTKHESEMTPQEMRRKGSWAVRFYGRANLPPLVDAKGRPTRHALSAHAWGEPVPKTVAAARRIAAKGERLLARYNRAKAKA